MFAEVVSDYQGGLLQDENVRWIGLSPIQIQRKLAERDYELSFILLDIINPFRQNLKIHRIIST